MIDRPSRDLMADRLDGIKQITRWIFSLAVGYTATISSAVALAQLSSVVTRPSGSRPAADLLREAPLFWLAGALMWAGIYAVWRPVPRVRLLLVAVAGVVFLVLSYEWLFVWDILAD